jgi:hypothetical protein
VRGRASNVSVGLFVATLLLGFAALRVLELAPPAAPVDPEPELAAGDGIVRSAWSATLELGGARVRARLVPLHDEAVLQSFRAGALRAHFALATGEPWRLVLALEPGSAAPLSVFQRARPRCRRDRDASAARARAGAGERRPAVDALRSRAGAARGRASSARSSCGAPPADGARLELAGEPAPRPWSSSARTRRSPSPRSFAGEPLDVETPPSPEDEVARLRSSSCTSARCAPSASRTSASSTGCSTRFRAWAAPPSLPRRHAATESEEERAQREAAEAARRARDEMGRALGVLMRFEGLRGMDLLGAARCWTAPSARVCSAASTSAGS